MSRAPLSRAQASAEVEDDGWRYVLGRLMAAVPVGSLHQAVEVATAAVSTCGPSADEHLRVVPRADRVDLELQTAGMGVTAGDVDLAHSVTDAVRALGLPIGPEVHDRSVQKLEVAIDALDIARIRPFWQAVLAYANAPGYDGPEDPLVDPTGEGPAVWFQQMEAPRPQRNRIHLDVSVPHDEAERRLRAALSAGGTLVSDARARAFWVLADAEGNEACISTWQDRE